MPIPEPVTPLEPWQTAWPAGVALFGLIVAMWRGRAHLRPRSVDLRWMVPLGLLALVVRLVVVPALSMHYFDGHEAEYWDIFRGAREVNRGGTVLYPTMQWMWWLLGTILPHHRLVPVVWMGLMGSLGCVVFAAAAARWTGRLGGVSAGLLVALHPVHAAWSTSAYNVIVPWLLSALVVWASSALSRSRNPPLALAWVAAFAWALVAATRMEAAWIAVPALLVALLDTAPEQPRMRRLRRAVSWIPAIGTGAALGAAAIVPLVFPGEVPGAGERALSFLINWAWWAPYAPLDGWVGLWSVLAVVTAAVWRRHLPALLFGGATVLAHLALASFDDLGDRHTLASLFALGLLVAAAVHGAGRMGMAGRGVATVLLFLCVDGLLDMRTRFYGSEESFSEVLRTDPQWAELPRWSVEQARDQCGWVSEDPRVAPQPQKSHFNLIDAAEAEALRGKEGCLRWCLDVQDWRWSSRGVRDRALRTARLYAIAPAAVVEDAGSGYACLVMELGLRRCCSPESVDFAGPFGPTTGPAFMRSHEEDDASGSLQHSPIP